MDSLVTFKYKLLKTNKINRLYHHFVLRFFFKLSARNYLMYKLAFREQDFYFQSCKHNKHFFPFSLCLFPFFLSSVGLAKAALEAINGFNLFGNQVQ